MEKGAGGILLADMNGCPSALIPQAPEGKARLCVPS